MTLRFSPTGHPFEEILDKYLVGALRLALQEYNEVGFMMDNRSQISTTEIRIRFRDVDAMGHVNNAVYFTYMEVARSQFFLGLLSIEDPLNLPVIIAEATCTFKKPAKYGDTLLVKVQVTRIGDKSFELGYEMIDQESQLVALGRTVMVAYDYTIRRTIRIPETMRFALETYHTD